MSKKRGSRKSSSSSTSLILIIIVLGLLVKYIVPILIVLGISGGIYYFYRRQIKLTATATTQRIEQLKSEIRQTDQEIKSLEKHYQEKKFQQYEEYSTQVLHHLSSIKQESLQLEHHIDKDVFRRIQDKITQVDTTIHQQLMEIEEFLHPTVPQTHLEKIESYALELKQIYENIQVDHQAILDKIGQSPSGNQAELTALHESEMERFYDVLDGYLKIKAEPKNYHNAEERLQKAKEAIEKFDLDLDETLRQLNEADLHDFDVSLRIISRKTTNSNQGESL